VLALKYYGIDWLAMALTFVALWLIGNKNKIGFMIMICGNMCWVSIGLLSESIAMVVANLVFLSMNGRAFWKWGRDALGGT
jgi:hypothetical protein